MAVHHLACFQTWQNSEAESCCLTVPHGLLARVYAVDAAIGF